MFTKLCALTVAIFIGCGTTVAADVTAPADVRNAACGVLQGRLREALANFEFPFEQHKTESVYFGSKPWRTKIGSYTTIAKGVVRPEADSFSISIPEFRIEDGTVFFTSCTRCRFNGQASARVRNIGSISSNFHGELHTTISLTAKYAVTADGVSLSDIVITNAAARVDNVHYSNTLLEWLRGPLNRKIEAAAASHTGQMKDMAQQAVAESITSPIVVNFFGGM